MSVLEEPSPQDVITLQDDGWVYPKVNKSMLVLEELSPQDVVTLQDYGGVDPRFKHY